MCTIPTRLLLLRRSTLAVALVTVGLGETLAQSSGMAALRSHEQAVSSPLEVFAFHAPQRAGVAPTMTLGMRYQLSEQHVLFANTSGVRTGPGMRALSAEQIDADATTKVGMEWKPAKSALGLERGAIGLQLDSGYRLSLRTRRGGAGLYLRGNF
ncbi:MAG: hypothetical protein V4792_11890 [Pseudomonadota bacterium]